MNAALEQAREQRVTVVASSGDTGAISDDGPPRQVSMPASDPLVLAVGGTTLDAARPSGAYQGEMAWNDGANASGGGYSGLFPRPSYQDGLARAGATRGVPDVAANADRATAMAIEYSDGRLRPAEGTSASTPLWAGMIALADQQAGQHLGFVNPSVAGLAGQPAWPRPGQGRPPGAAPGRLRARRGWRPGRRSAALPGRRRGGGARRPGRRAAAAGAGWVLAGRCWDAAVNSWTALSPFPARGGAAETATRTSRS